MGDEVEQLLALHNRVLQQCWTIRRRVGTVEALQAHAAALRAAGRRLQQLLDMHAEALPAKLRQESMRAVARTWSIAEAMQTGHDRFAH